MRILTYVGAAVVFVIAVAIFAVPSEEMIDLQMQQMQAEGAALMQDIENQVAVDAVEQYQIVSRNGSPMDRCVQAGMVAAAYLQASDEAAYARWKETETRDCAAAGLR